ncbi:hypothetical protein S7711_00565 [Stachybotrys chartarum IBT 7711]|uniref:Copper transport protein n=1 Tax=Stachybotrys chartarum (strain CBS 109288 / IBT 7711) TaxID=1280523 RepID=A0A084ATR2_STACB|nr:hypothetical protein S7711_00565 [Stachybotrys chartarum IBT 7711]KFA79296.1 hypothetical protein S40288_03441 [Stachybotrys chartarum IBT 40288]
MSFLSLAARHESMPTDAAAGALDSGMGDGHASMDMTTPTAAAAGHEGMMFMVFQSMIDTPLYAEAWTPRTTAQYAATCFFLFILAVFVRAVIALKAQLEARWHAAQMSQRLDTVSSKSVEDSRYTQEQHHLAVSPWNLRVDPVRAALDVVAVGAGYLLMLAVMTMNVGYFLSVLAGVFSSSLAFGRFSTGAQH